MTILTVRHITTYQYKQPVAFGEHRMMLRPRESHDQRLLESKLEITPKPTNLRWIQDVFGNHVAIARFAGRAEALRFDSTIRLDHSAADIVDMDIEGFARAYPFIYDARDLPDLAHFIERQSSDPHHQLDRWVHKFLRKGGSTNTRSLLVKLTRTIQKTFVHVARHEKGIQDPLLTLKIGSGSCRDLAMLMIEAVRSLGMAARFVSGYLHVPENHNGDARGGNTHAWVQVYLPGPGWVDFDPASGIIGNQRPRAYRGGARSTPGDTAARYLDRFPLGQFGNDRRGQRHRKRNGQLPRTRQLRNGTLRLPRAGC